MIKSLWLLGGPDPRFLASGQSSKASSLSRVADSACVGTLGSRTNKGLVRAEKGIQNQRGVEEMDIVLRGEKMLDKFENAPELKEEDDIAEMFEEDEDVTKRVTTTLRDHVSHWEATGASKFCLSVIKDGYIPQPEGLSEGIVYEEKNNKSYHENKEFANKAVEKMLRIGVVKRVKTSRFVSPLT